MDEKASQRSVIYTESRLSCYFFSPACTASLLPDRLVLSLPSEYKKRVVIPGDLFILQKIYDNLRFGTEEHVLKRLLDFCEIPDLLTELKEGHYIE